MKTIFVLFLLVFTSALAKPIQAQQYEVSFRSNNGQYVVAENGGGGIVNANRVAIGPWERFVIVDLNGGALQNGDIVNIKSVNGLFLVAEGGGGQTLNANRPAAGPWERFRILRLGGDGQLQNSDAVALETVNGRYVVAEGGGGGRVNANRTAIGPWERFTLVVHGKSEARAGLFMRQICCDKTTEAGADEVYFIIAGRSNTGRELFARLPGPSDHRDMNDGDQGTKPYSGYSGDAHCVANGSLFNDIRDGETWNFAVLVMEEDGGTSRDYQSLASQALKMIDHPIAQAAGHILGVLTKLGLFFNDTDDYIGSFGVQATNHGGAITTEWRNGDRVVLSQNDPDAPGDPNRHEFRMNGDGSNYVGWFSIR